MEDRIPITIKVLPPFTSSLTSVEKTLYLRGNPTIMDLLTEASSQGILAVGKVVNGDEVRDGVVILVNGRTVFDIKSKLSRGDKVVIMPLAPGG
ncbi:MAG: hypothetical protein N3D82_00785 [Ignisphaera sp.]|nr:hypothetical protein [Ignisphaera sp.]MCX8167550.1 hypothetical protein [Ignisphaera sp.]MDW8086209.1 hypothetical protein [Ignisphaera sp.]